MRLPIAIAASILGMLSAHSAGATNTTINITESSSDITVVNDFFGVYSVQGNFTVPSEVLSPGDNLTVNITFQNPIPLDRPLQGFGPYGVDYDNGEGQIEIADYPVQTSSDVTGAVVYF